jgi:hypothetical protein
VPIRPLSDVQRTLSTFLLFIVSTCGMLAPPFANARTSAVYLGANGEDRFARAAFYINAIPKSEDPDPTVASVFSVIRNVRFLMGLLLRMNRTSPQRDGEQLPTRGD